MRELRPYVQPAKHPPTARRLLVLFLDGVGGGTLQRASRDGTMPFLGALRDHRWFAETRGFSGMPSTTTAFQAGLFYGLHHPDVPAFSWLDRSEGEEVHMNAPAHAARIDAALERRAGPGLFAGGTTYLSILRGSAHNRGSTAAFAEPFRSLGRRELPALLRLAPQTGLRMGTRLIAELPPLLWEMAAFATRTGSTRHELGFLLNHVGVATALQEIARSSVLVDLVSGVPRTFHCIHDFDEVAHRRGPDRAMAALRHVDRTVEAIVAVAAASPDPPDVWVITDHGLISSVPFERLFGCSLADWLAGAGGETPSLPPEVASALGGRAQEPSLAPPRVVTCGNYAHVYLGADRPLHSDEIHARHRHVLARALDCPGVGFVALRGRDGAMAFASGRRIDPRSPAELPLGTTSQSMEALLDDLQNSPSSGDLVLYGSSLGDACVAFSWEHASHGGPSPTETETFVIHPKGIPLDSWGVSHGADLHNLLAWLYGRAEGIESE